MTAVTKALMSDHRKVEKLFSRFEQSGEPDLAQQVCEELKVHTTLEEELVYPILERKVDKGMAKEANEEHAEADALIKKIESSLSDHSRLTALMTELKKAVEHHVEEEENEVFPKMERQAGNDLAAIEGKFIERKQALAGTAAVLAEMTKDELQTKAAEADIRGRSTMTKDELVAALSDAG